MPARRAIASVDAPWKPERANSSSAAARTSSRRSSAVCRVTVDMGSDYSLTKPVLSSMLGEAGEDGAHAIDLVLARRRREGEGQRALERPVRPREGALRAVGAEPVDRPGPDLRLDPLLAKRIQRLVPAVELDDVRLPAVPVAVGRPWRQHEMLEALLVPAGYPLARLEQLVQAGELRDADRTQEVGQAVVEAGRGQLAGRDPAVVPEPADGRVEIGVVRRDRAALARRDDLARVEREAAERPERSARRSPVRSEEHTSELQSL